MPQLFIRKQLIGGADDTLGYFRSLQYNSPEEWDELTSMSSSSCLLDAPSLKRSLSKDTSHDNPRLMIPITEEDETDEETDVTDHDLCPVKHSHGGADQPDNSGTTGNQSFADGPGNLSLSPMDTVRIDAPDRKSMTVLETTEKMKHILHYTKRRWNFTDYKSCCTGKEVVDSFVNEYSISRSQAEDFGKVLWKHNILHHVTDPGSEFKDTSSKFYRLQCFQTPNVLNSYRIWPRLAKPADPETVMQRVLGLFGRVEEAITGHDGYINYKIAYMCSDFVALQDAICELQQVDLGRLKNEAMMVCLLNECVCSL